MPVLHYPPVIGGFEVFLQNIAERIGKKVDIYVLTGKVQGVSSEEHRGGLHILRKGSLYTLHDLSHSSYFYILTALPILFFRSLILVYRQRITVLHANGFFNGIVCFLVSKITRVPYIMTIQSADFTIYHARSRLNGVQSWVERVIYRGAMVCHAVSDDLCRHYARQGINQCVMIPNGVETDLFRPLEQGEREYVRAQYEIPKNARVVITTSRLTHKNGVHDLIDAVASLEVLLVIAGDGVERARLEARVREENMEHKVLFLGHVPHVEVGKLVGASDIYARTPLAEGFGIVFLEAMAAGVPVVATHVGGIPEFVTDGETGLLVSPGDVAGITRALEKLISDAQLRSVLVKNGQNLISEKYNWDDISVKILKLYEKAHVA